jgi:hypothetical protein
MLETQSGTRACDRNKRIRLTIIVLFCSQATLLRTALEVVVCGVEKFTVHLRSVKNSIAASILAWVDGKYCVEELVYVRRMHFCSWGTTVGSTALHKIIAGAVGASILSFRGIACPKTSTAGTYLLKESNIRSIIFRCQSIRLLYAISCTFSVYLIPECF